MTDHQKTHSHVELITAARTGDVSAYAELVRITQPMSLAVALQVLRDTARAEDAVQQAYLHAFRRLQDLKEPAAFAGWLRRIVLTVALNIRRSRRVTLLSLDDVPDVPVLDEAESRWSELQRDRLATALLTLNPAERRICDRRYYGSWPLARLASDARVSESTMRKRLQRIRDKLRQHIEAKEMDMVKESGMDPAAMAPDLPAKIVHLLARPQLTDIPENPVGRVLQQLREAYSEFDEKPLPEIVDLTDARSSIANDAMYLNPSELHYVDADKILRYDLTLPLLLSVRYEGAPVRVWASGKAYRACQTDATHLEAFHQFEALWVDDLEKLDPWQFTGRILRSVDRTLPGRSVKIMPVEYPMCARAWELAVDDNGQWTEVMAWGAFTDRIVRYLGGDPARHAAMGVGYGLERFAMLRYGIDDIRKIDLAQVA